MDERDGQENLCLFIPLSLKAVPSSDLFLMDFKCIAILHLQRVGGISWLNTLTFEQKTNRSHVLSLSIAKRTHQLLKLGAPFDFEENFVVIVCHLDIEMLADRGCFGGVSIVLVFRHVVDSCEES